MLKALIKKQLLEIFANFRMSWGKTQKKTGMSMLVTVLLFILILGSLGAGMYAMSSGILQGLKGTSMEWLFFAIMILLAILLGTLGSVFSTYSSLYLPKDNDILLALPVQPSKIILSRMIGVYSMSLLYTGIVWIPAMIAYWVNAAAVSVVTILNPILMLLVLSLFVQVLTCFFGWLVAMAASRLKGKSYITVIISVVFLCAYYYIYFKIVGNAEEILSKLGGVGAAIQNNFYPIYAASQAASGDITKLLILLGIVLALFTLCVVLISLNYTRLITMTAVTKKVKYVEKTVQKNSIETALLKREFKHFTSSSSWMLNTGLGLLMLPILAIFALIKKNDLQQYLLLFQSELPITNQLVPAIVATIVCLIVSMNAITAPSVSLEGKNMWILQSLPAEPRKILQAKERMALILNLAVVVPSVLLLAMAFQIEWIQVPMILINCILFVCVSADLGLLMDLAHPNLHWTNEVEPVKKSLPVFVSLFGGMLLTIGIGGCSFLLITYLPGLSASMAAVPYALVLLIGYLTMHLWILKKGATKFAAL